MMLKSKDVTIGDIVMSQSGYFNIAGYKPQGMNHFLFAILWTYGDDSKHGALGVNANGNFVFSTAGGTLSYVTIRYFYYD